MTNQKEKVTYPQLICEVCGFKNQLKFNPKERLELLQDLVCTRCQHYAYWERNGQKPGDLQLHYSFSMDEGKLILRR